MRHHFRQTDWELVRSYARAAGHRRPPWLGMLHAMWRHGATFEDYYDLGFFCMGESERRTWITRSRRHEITRQLNDPREARVCSDKLRFARHFGEMLGRRVWDWSELAQIPPGTRLGPTIAKPRFGHGGKGILVPPEEATHAELCGWMRERCPQPETYLVEERLRQHPDLAQLSPDSVNTLRFVTILRDDVLHVIGLPCLRMGVGAPVDNVKMGGIAASVGLDGVVRTPAVGRSPFAPAHAVHPRTDQAIVGFRVPHFAAIRPLLERAARLVPRVQSLGWDIAITPDGPVLIEANPAWSHLFQIFDRVGRRAQAAALVDLTLVYD